MMPPLSNSLYFVRHGETDANKRGLMCGSQWDIDLNDNGHAQARQEAQALKNSALKIDYIISSPLLRAKNTAQHFSEALNLPIALIDDLKEWDLGDWNGKPSAEISPVFDANLDPPHGEPVAVFHKRVVDAIEKIERDYVNALIVSHGAVWKRICLHFGSDFRQIENCKVMKI
jgi:probable phosphoglycerate mutase